MFFLVYGGWLVDTLQIVLAKVICQEFNYACVWYAWTWTALHVLDLFLCLQELAKGYCLCAYLIMHTTDCGCIRTGCLLY